jgi:hypothetical protein
MSKPKLRVSVALTNILLMVFILWRVAAMASEADPSPEPNPAAPLTCVSYNDSSIPLWCDTPTFSPSFHCCNTPAPGYCCQYLCSVTFSVPTFGIGDCSPFLTHSTPFGPYKTTCGGNGVCVGFGVIRPMPVATD